jgi:endonuclease YncB( thermonuclease family)
VTFGLGNRCSIRLSYGTPMVAARSNTAGEGFAALSSLSQDRCVMFAFGFRLVLGLVLAASGVGLAMAADPALCGGKPTAVRITEALDGASLKLADGRVVRLSNLIAPLPIDGDKDAIMRAKETLAEIANGKDALLYVSSEAKDRYGRISAQSIAIGEKLWLEAELLSRGLVRVFPGTDDNCAKALLQYEAKARAIKAGFWSGSRFAVLDANNIEALLAAEGRFVIVEGTIRRVGEARGRVYLDFGRRFTEDFTIIVPDGIRKSLVAQGSDPKSWRGRRVRVRGILFSWGGPAIEVNLALAIELLNQTIPDQKIPKSE